MIHKKVDKNVIYLFIICTALFFLSACGSLKNDDQAAAVLVNYPTAEIEACGSLIHGLGICTMYEGDDVSGLNIAVRGYYQGNIKVVSGDCDIDQNYSYKNSELVAIKFDKAITKSCVLSVVVSPIYPKQTNDSIVVYPLVGYLYLKVLPKDAAFSGFVTKIATGEEKEINLAISSGSTTSRVVMKSDLCGVNFDKTLNVKNGYVTLDTSSITATDQNKCIINGVYFDGTKPIRFSWLVWKYLSSYSGASFSPLAIPSVEVNGDKLKVTSDSRVSIVALDTNLVLSNVGIFNFDSSSSHILRALTVKGRTAIGIYQNGGWKWQQ